MKHVLCVGEEQPLWRELRNPSSAFSKEWKAEFAQTGPEALARAEAGSFDAVVADVQLFDMSGVDLLDEIMQRQPKAFRIVLSEHGDLESTVRCIGKAHHHLLKPCEVSMLVSALNQGLTPCSWMPGPSVQKLVGKMRWVPSPPNLYFRIAMEMESPAASVETIGQIIAEDPPITAKVLQLANSAVFGLQLQVTQPAEAVAYLGLEATRTLVLLAHTFSEFEGLPRVGFSVDELWFHSVLVGQFARQIALVEQQEPDPGEQAYAAGLLHDLGKILFAANLPKPFGEAVTAARQEQTSLHAVEKRILGANHAEIGACLLAIWGLPPDLVEAVALHHEPSAAAHKVFGPLTAVHAADVFSHQAAPDHPEVLPIQLDQAYLRELGLLDRSELWRRHCQDLKVEANP
jgi:HD-like signal output (HDOD) protein/CheY-like chemotaxis protein